MHSASLTPSTGQISFSAHTYLFPTSISTRYASSVPAPSLNTTYALPYVSVADQLHAASTTSWPDWTPLPTAAILSTTSQYDDVAFSNLWEALNPANFTRGIYTTTATPTPIPSSELVYPPPLVYRPKNERAKFPKSFILGAAGSSAQCEGAVADEGKSPSLLDALYTLFALIGNSISTSSLVPSGSLDSDYTTNEHYYLFKQDIDRFAAIGLKHYSFSIPMVRILPFALPGSPINQQAIQHYSDMIDYVLKKGLEPIVTLFHWETPLQFYGGGSFGAFAASLETALANHTYGVVPGFSFGFDNSTFQDAYVNYAQIVLSHFADRVPKWVTFNEPQIGARNGVAVDTVLKAHMRTVQFYRNVLHGNGSISMKMGVAPALPRDSTNTSDVQAAMMFNDIYIAPYLNPLVLGKDYPQTFKTAVPDYVPLTQQDLLGMKNTLDYVSVDVYTPSYVSLLTDNYTQCASNLSTSNLDRAFPICLNSSSSTTTGWAQGWNGGTSSVITTSTLRYALRYLYSTYHKPIMISETGFPTQPPATLEQNLFNYPQSVFLLNELDEVLTAIHEDKIDVIGMLVWNWGDDLEFTTFDRGFGLMFVNHTTQERRYRRSFFDIIDFVETRRKT